ncbi:MAG: hypothetical protein ACI4JM_12050 [Oscillospiraceae bacterium]
MKKALKRIFTVIICMPIVLIVLFIGYEIIGIAVNDYSANKQTKNLLEDISNVSDIEILDSYTYCGNTGNGNHVDMLSLVLVRSDDEPKNSRYGNVRIRPYENLSDINLQGKYYGSLNYPENKENLYVIVLNNPAPFYDNIVGH